jgi:hypothetical protein
MHAITVQITKFVDAAYPGFVECEFVDAHGRKHTIMDKVPVVSTEELDWTSEYPRPGAVRCQVLSQSRDEANRELVRITTTSPDSVESTKGLSEFVVLSSQLLLQPSPAGDKA